MEQRIGTISIIIYDKNAVAAVNHLLSEYSNFILSRLGLPLREKNLNIITLVIETTMDNINALTGKLGRIANVEAKSLITKNKN
jgi:putative iron-only hydrogenase system regulator